MRLVLFLPWLTNCLRPVGVHPPSDSPHPVLSLREVVTFLAWERHQTPGQYWSLWLPVLGGPAARTGCVPVHLSAKASLTTEMGLDSLGYLPAAALLSIELGGGVVGGACWHSRKVTLRKYCQVTSAHPLPAQENWRAVFTVQRDMVACVGACLTYVPKNTTPWLSTNFFLKNPSYIHI